MTDQERIARLERLVTDLCLALVRKNTEKDGQWGYPSHMEEFDRIANVLMRSEATGHPS